MNLAHEIVDPQHNKRLLLDHAVVVVGGEITKAAAQLDRQRPLSSQPQPNHVHRPDDGGLVVGSEELADGLGQQLDAPVQVEYLARVRLSEHLSELLEHAADDRLFAVIRCRRLL
jgi:hypothetical protein